MLWNLIISTRSVVVDVCRKVLGVTNGHVKEDPDQVEQGPSYHFNFTHQDIVSLIKIYIYQETIFQAKLKN